ncbi:hypothetical protein THS27_04160 [Thalassospira sp. MCCC 1A01428]|nr:hypothetical protein THS27_04160 [Thalassospira sp. MCCC 1A01428]
MLVPLNSVEDGSIRILAGRSLFDPTPIEVVLPAQGKTITDILLELRATGGINPHYINDQGLPLRQLALTVWVSDWNMHHNQIEIPVVNWHRVRVKPGTSLAIAIKPYGGGGGGGKSAVRILLTIVVIAVSIYTGGAAAFAAGQAGYGAAASAAIGAAAGAAVTAIGNVLINSIVPPPTGNISAARGDFARDSESPTWSLDGIANDPDPYGPIPQLYGVKRITPPRVTEFYTENIGDDVYARVTLGCGYGPMRFSEPRFGTTPVENFEDVELEYREGWMDDAPSALFADQPQTDNYNIRITNQSPVIVESREADELVIDYACTGLVYFDDNGNRQNRTVEAKIDIKRLDVDEEFVSAPSSAAPLEASSFLTRVFAPVGKRWVVYRSDYAVNGPVTITLFSRAGSYFGSSPLSGYQYKVFVRSYDPDHAELTADNQPPSSFALYWQSSKIAPGASQTQTITPPLGGRIEIAVLLDIYWVSGSNPKWIPNNFPAADPTWLMYDDPEISYMTTAANVERVSLSITAASENSVRRSVRIALPSHGRYAIRTRRLTADSDSTRVRDDLYITAVKSIIHQQPLNKKGIATISFRAKAGDQLQGLLDRFSARATRLLPVYDRDTQTWDWHETKNPAWAALWCLMGEAVAQPCGVEKIDLPMWLALADFCARKPPQSDLPDHIDPESSDTPYFRYSGYFRDRRAATRRAQDILSSCRAQLVMVAGKYSVIWEDPDPVRVSYLGPENCLSLTRKRTFVNLPHGLRVQWRDAAENDRELIVYRDGFSFANATLFETLELEGCDGDDLAWREGRYWFAVAQLRQKTTTAIVGYEHLRFGLGSMVGVSHPVPKIGVASGRIKAVSHDEDGNVVTITLDQPVPFDGEHDYCVRMWLAKGGTAYSTVTHEAGEYLTLTLDNPVAPRDFADPESAPVAGNYFQFGIVGYELRDMLVKNIARRDDFHALVELVDAAPEIHLADQVAIPDPEPAPTPGLAAPPGPVTDLVITEKVTRIGNETQSTLLVSWRPAEGQLVASYQVHIAMGDDSAVFYAPVIARNITIPVELQGRSYRVWVVAVAPSGNRLAVSESSFGTIFVSGKLAAPATPGNVKLSFASGMATIATDPQNDADKFVLTIATPVSAGASLGGTLAANQEIEFAGSATTVPVPLKGEYVFTLQAANFQGTRSAPVTRRLTQNRAWAPNAVASLAVPTTGGSFNGSIGRTDSGQIRRPSIVGAAWSDPESANDVELFNGLWDLADVPTGELASLPVSWFVGPQLTDIAEWVSEIVDFGEDLHGVWWSDQKAEILDYSAIVNWNDVPTSVLENVDNRLLRADGAATIGVVLELGQQSDLSDATAVAGHWDGTARYGRVRVRITAQSWVIEAYASDITIHCDAPDEIDAGTGTISGTPPDTVTFNRTFAVIPAVTVTAENGDSAALVTASVSKTGFQITGTAGSKFVWHASGVKNDL